MGQTQAHSLTIQTGTEEQACRVTLGTHTLQFSQFQLMLQEVFPISIRLEALNLPWSPAGHFLLPESRPKEGDGEEWALQDAF